MGDIIKEKMTTIDKLKKNGIYLDLNDVQRVCKKYHIIELAVFGSSLRDDFNKDSDIDLLVSIKKKAKISLFDIMDAEEEFSQLLKREVQIVEKEGLKNRRRSKRILSTSELIYAE